MSALAGWDDLGCERDGVRLAHRARQSGGMPLLLIHGIGPGTTGWANFAPLLERLTADLAPHVIDLAGFGSSGRLPGPEFFDVGFWRAQIEGAIERVVRMHGRAPMLVGNSVGGALALGTAAARTDIPAVVAIGAPARAVVTPELRAFWTAPRTMQSLADAMRPMTGDARAPDPAVVAARFAKFAEPGYADYFASMLADPAACLAAAVPTAGALAPIATRVTLLHGRLDRACSEAATLALFADLPGADLVLFGGCGHNLISERTAALCDTLTRIAGTIGNR